ncbi:MAG: tRNA preQ1(34) S-adenosylmethionine ribosyltransferase-isomerase QueA [Acidobacteriota bacterium]
MQISQFDYELPADLIAQEPLEKRDASRMMVLDRKRLEWSDSAFKNFPEYVRPNDVLVINNTRVFPARIIGHRDPSGGRVEVLLVRELEPLLWEALVRPGRRLTEGSRIKFGKDRLLAEVLDAPGEELRRLRFECNGEWEAVLDEVGETPLPPYISRPSGASKEDRERYQTLFASARGAIAAPTAGLHFSAEITQEVLARGAKVEEITLHVGYGTFEPIHVADSDQHHVAAERFEISKDAAESINSARKAGGRVIAVGTTTTRALESAIDAAGRLLPTKREAELTITPGYDFRIVDALLTNFHLPRSSLLLLVSAFGGRDFILDAYRHAVESRYRFYSYGDCMLLI